MTFRSASRPIEQIRRMIVRLELAPGAVVREDDAAAPARHRPHADPRGAAAARARSVRHRHAPPRDVRVDASTCPSCRCCTRHGPILEPYAARLACARGRPAHWDGDGARASPRRRATERDAGRADRDRSRVPRDHLGRRRATASSPTPSTCSTPRATGSGTCTSPTSPTCCTPSTSTADPRRARRRRRRPRRRARRRPRPLVRRTDPRRRHPPPRPTPRRHLKPHPFCLLQIARGRI